MRIERIKILEELEKKQKSQHPILGVAAGNGLIAMAADLAEVDFIAVYSGAWYRNHGVTNLLCEFPYSNSNQVTLEMGKYILPRIVKSPVIAGVGCQDPYCKLDVHIKSLLNEGFSGVMNFPSIGEIEKEGLTKSEKVSVGFWKEVTFICECHERDIFTIANCYTVEQAMQMIKAGADMICFHVGMILENEEKKIKEIGDAICTEKVNSYFILYNDINRKEQERVQLLRKTKVQGFFENNVISSLIKDTVTCKINEFQNCY